LLACACAWLLVIGFSAAVARTVDTAPAAVAFGGSPRSTTTAPTATTSTTISAAEVALREVVGQLQAWVAAERGLAFLEPVDVAVLDDAEFEAAVDAGQSGRNVGTALTPLGLDADAAEVVTAGPLDPEGVLGFYDAYSDRLVVRTRPNDLAVRRTIVHELVHALQDQHSDLTLDFSDGDVHVAMESLLEGDAMRIEHLWLQTLDHDQRVLAEADEPFLMEPGFIPLGPGFPYIVGQEFVQALIDAGGIARVNAALNVPPTSSEQILHPERFLAGQAPVVVHPPSADQVETARGTLGELGLLALLKDNVADWVALTAADGWGGDSFVAWGEGDQSCVRAVFVADSDGDAEQLRAALTEAGSHTGRGTVTAGTANEIVYTACGVPAPAS
jgi:hypothetical protein